MSNELRYNKTVSTVAGVGIFSALAAVVSFLTSFLKISFLSIDLGDIIIVLSSYVYGPVSGIAVSLISALCSFLYSGTGFWGFLMDFISSAVFSFVAAFVYYRKKNFKFAIVGIYAAVVAVVIVMIPLNILIVPLFSKGITSKDVIPLIPTLLLPFNLFKACLNGGAVLMLYKPVVNALRKARLISSGARPHKEAESKFKQSNTSRALIIGLVTILLSAVGLIVLKLLS